VQLDYEGQRKRTKVKSRDLDPTWNEKVRHLMPRLRAFPKLQVVRGPSVRGCTERGERV
jgi:hypothetical protein